jgi:uncharacterized membrane protein
VQGVRLYVVVLAAALVALAFVWSPAGGQIVAKMAAAALVIFVPGLAMISVLRRDQASSSVELATLAVGSSLSAMAIGGLLLDRLGVGLTAPAWAALLAVASTPLAVHLPRLLKRLRAVARSRPDARWLTSGWIRIFALVGLATLILFSAIEVARDSALNQPRPGFSELWLVPTQEPDRTTLTIGVMNNEQRIVDYRVVVRMPRGVMADWASIELQPGKVWTETVDGILGADVPITAELFNGAQRESIRRVIVWPSDLADHPVPHASQRL